MSKISLKTIDRVAGSEATLNSNFNIIKEAIENTISRDGTTPNNVTADLDLNSKDLLNVKNINATTFTVNGSDITESIHDSVAAAAASASSASTSESNASTSETNAAASEAAASTSESNAATSESNAASSATAADNTLKEFETIYLGAFASAPTLDNEGNALITGAEYFDTVTNSRYVYDGATWLSSDYNSAAVDITGGTLNGTSIGGTTPASGVFTYLEAQGTFPVVKLTESDGTVTHNVTEIDQNGDILNFMTRANSGTFVAYDYRIEKGASGASIHRWYQDGSEVMRLNGTGLGIGELTPDYPLHVTGTAGITALLEDTGGSYAQFRLKSDGTTNRRVLALDSSDNVEAQIQLGDGRIDIYGSTTSADAILAAPQLVGKFNVKYWGAVGDGATDDSGDIGDALDHVISNGGVMEVPAGEYLLSSAISRTLTGAAKKFGIVGSGIQSSRFTVPSGNTTGAFLLDATGTADRSDEALFEGFSIESQAAGGVGLRFLQNPGGVQDLNTVICRDVRLWTVTTGTNYFTTAFDFSGAWRPLIENCFWAGPVDGYTHALTDPVYDCTYALKLHNSYDPIVLNSRFKGCVRGIDSTDVRTGNESEALTISDCVINQCRYGVYFERTGQEPLVKIQGTHINYRDQGIRIDGAKLVDISGCLIYNEDSGNIASGAPTDIYLLSARYFNVHDNQFHFDGHTSRIGVNVIGTSPAGQSGYIKDNLFADVTMNYGINLAASTAGLRGDNHYSPEASFGTAALNDVPGTNNVTNSAI